MAEKITCKEKGLSHEALKGVEAKIVKAAFRTIRDEFALGAMQAILSNPNVRDPDPKNVAGDAYLVATAMMQERAKEDPQ